MAPCFHAVLAHATLVILFEGASRENFERTVVGEPRSTVAPQRGSSGSLAPCFHAVLVHATSVLLFWGAGQETKRAMQGN